MFLSIAKLRHCFNAPKWLHDCMHNICMRTVQQYEDRVESVRSLYTLPLGQCNTHVDNTKFVSGAGPEGGAGGARPPVFLRQIL